MTAVSDPRPLIIAASPNHASFFVNTIKITHAERKMAIPTIIRDDLFKGNTTIIVVVSVIVLFLNPVCS